MLHDSYMAYVYSMAVKYSIQKLKITEKKLTLYFCINIKTC